MTEYKIRITPYAKRQVQDIRDYIKYQLMNPDAAKNLLIEINKQMKKLEYMADSIKIIEDQPWGSQGVRRITVKNYYLYFWIDSE